jgi:hypothetical protein
VTITATETLSFSNNLVTVTIVGNCQHPVYTGDNSNCHHNPSTGGTPQLSLPYTFISDNSATDTLSFSNNLVTVTIGKNCHRTVYAGDNSQLSPPHTFIGDRQCMLKKPVSNCLVTVTMGVTIEKNCHLSIYTGDNSQMSMPNPFIGDSACYRDSNNLFLQQLGDNDNRG